MKKVLYVVIVAIGLSLDLQAADWPMWKYDAGHTASTPHRLAGQLHPQWTLSLSKPRPAWRDKSNTRVYFDVSYEPVVAGSTMLVGSMNDDTVTAYDTRTGRRKWRFFTGGPVRFAPALADGRAYVGSDDGYLYCLSVDDGSLLWKIRGGPADDRLLGNGRLISRWPVRGAPAVLDGRVYFAASIWPCEGTFIYCIDAGTGKTIWCNSGSGAAWITQPHGAPSFAGVSPQGCVAIGGDKVLVPSGRSAPGAYDRRSGEFLYFHHHNYPRNKGGFAVNVQGDVFINHGVMYRLADGELIAEVPEGVCDKDALYATHGDRLMRCAYRKDYRVSETVLGESVGRAMIKCGDTVYCANGGNIAVIDVSGDAKISWRHTLDAKVWSMLAADERLFVVTVDGKIHCFGAERVRPEKLTKGAAPGASPTAAMPEIQSMLAAGSEGYCIVLGLGDGRAVEGIVGASQMHVIVVEADADKVRQFRALMQKRGLYGDRVAVVHSNPLNAGLPPYLANLILIQDAGALEADAVRRVYRSLRPYGGVAFFAKGHDAVRRAGGIGELTPAKAGRSGRFLTLTRPGPLPGSASWTHQYGDAGNSVASRDSTVKLPLGVLWFGGPTNDQILPRHGHGPAPQVCGGRLFIEGENLFRCMDVYTGRLLWERTIDKIGYYFRQYHVHFPGADEIGSNYVSFPDAVYLASPEKCMKLDPATGKTTKEFRLPPRNDGNLAHWGFINGSGRYLVAANSPVRVDLKDQLVPPASEARYVSEKLTSTTYNEGGIPISVDIQGAKQLMLVLVPDNPQDSVPCVWIDPKLTGPRGEKKLTTMSWNWGFSWRSRWSELILEPPVVGIVRNLDKKVDGITASNKSAIMYDLPEGYTQFTCRVTFKKKPRPRHDAKAIIHAIKNSKRTTPVRKFEAAKGVMVNTRYGPSSKDLHVLDRQTGKVLWHKQANYSFRHNTIVMSEDKLFCIDGITAMKHAYLKRRGLALENPPMLTAFDLATGKIAWRKKENVFGTWLGYSAEHDLLVQAGSRGGDRAWDEVDKGVVVYRASNGEVVWKDMSRSYSGPLILNGKQMISNGYDGGGFSLLTGESLGWKWARQYGCNTAIACKNLLTFRSGAAGYYDITNLGGTGNLGGFKSGCTSSLIPADGLLNAPDYTRTCECSYQNQTSLAFVHTPEADFWTYGGTPDETKVGINFGAPGDRAADNGTLWSDYPSVGGRSLKRSVNVRGGTYFRHHSRLFSGELAWVGSSGVQGAEQINVPLEKGLYAVRLYFAEPDKLAVSGERIFDVIINGKTVLSKFDPCEHAQNSRSTIIKLWDRVEVDTALKVKLKAEKGKTLLCGIEAILIQ